VQLLPGIGGKGADKLWKAFEAGLNGSKDGERKLAVVLQGCATVVPKKALVAWAQLATTISQLEKNPVRGNASKMIRLVVEAGYDEYLKETHTNFRNRLDDLDQLASFAQQFASCEEFLSQLALLTNLEAEAEEASPQGDDERVRLSTIHQAKGLEFDIVFVIMLCDGMFPSARSVDSPEGVEEERRLFYVAITRARNELYLSHPLVRVIAGGGDAMQQPSRFLSEIPRELVEEWDLKPAYPYG
jgi:DNA helicase-2/ATP-dependent DNA helicase PcrA